MRIIKPKLDEARQRLAAAHIPMARSMLHQYRVNWPRHREEFESAALLALVDAARTFDAERKVKFATFARFRIEGSLRDVQRRLVPRGYSGDIAHRPIEMQWVPGQEEFEELSLTRADEVEAEVDYRDEVETWIRYFPEDVATSIRGIYFAGKSRKEIADSLGCSKTRVWSLHAEAIDRLQADSRVREAATEYGYHFEKSV